MGRMPKWEGTDANYPDRIFPAIFTILFPVPKPKSKNTY